MEAWLPAAEIDARDAEPPRHGTLTILARKTQARKTDLRRLW